MPDIVCLVVFIITLLYWIYKAFMPSKETMSNASLLCMKAYMVILKSIRGCTNTEHLRYIDTQITDFEQKYQGRVYDEVLAMMVNDLGWEIVNRKSEL